MSSEKPHGPFKGAFLVIKDSARVIKDHPEIALYPYTAFLFISISYPIVSSTLFAHWYGRIFSDVGVYAPHKVGIIIGLVGFSAFYTALVTAYFTCIVSAGVLAKLEGRPTPAFYGIRQVSKRFIRISRFAILSVFLFPVGVYAQRKKLRRGFIGVLGSSLTLHMAQLAPAILSTRKGFSSTVRDSVEILGRAWHEGLILKIGMYVMIFLVVALPKLIQHGLFKSHAASDVGWLISLELATSSLVTFKVINSIFTTVLYYQAKQKNT